MKRLFLTLGVFLFAGGTYYLGQNYTFVKLDNAQLAQVGTSNLQSSTLTTTDEN